MKIKIKKTKNKKSTKNKGHIQWWILGEANEAVASGPPFFLGPPSKTAYTVLDSLQMFAQRTIRSEDLFIFFLENALILGEK